MKNDDLVSRSEEQIPSGESLSDSIFSLTDLIDLSTCSSSALRDKAYGSLTEGELGFLLSRMEFFESSEKQSVLEALVFMNHFTDERLLSVMSRLTEEEQGTMVYFLGVCTDTVRYIDSFQTYFESLSAIDPQSVGLDPSAYPRGILTDRFTKEMPEKAILVAPFVDLTRLCVTEEGEIRGQVKKNPRYSRTKSKEKAVETKPYLQVYAPYYKDATELIERVIRHPHTAENPQYAKALVQYYHEQNQSAVILPYLPELVDRGVISIEDARVVLKEGEQVYTRSTKSMFRSPEEQAQIRSLEEKTRHIYPEKFKDQSYIDRYEMPESFRRIELTLTKLEIRRTAEHMLSNPEALKGLFSSDAMWDRFLASMMSCDQPVFSVLPEGSFTVDDVRRLIRIAEEEGDSLSYSHRVQETRAIYEAGYERGAYTMLLEVMDQDINFAHEIMADFEEIQSFLSPGRFKTLCETIDRSCPGLWLSNIAAMEAYSQDSLGARVDKLATTEKLPYEYMKLYNYIRMEEEKGRDPSITREELQATARGMLERNPSLMFQDPFFSQAFPNESRSALAIATLREQPNEEFILDCLYHMDRKANDEFSRSVQQPLREAIVEHEDTIAAGLVNKAYRNLEDIFSRNERLDILFRHLDTLDPGEAYYSYDYTMAQDLVSRPDKMKEFLDHFSKEDANPAMLEHLGDSLGSIRNTLYGNQYSKPQSIKGLSLEKFETAMSAYRAHIAVVSLRKPTILLHEDVQEVMNLDDSALDVAPALRKLAEPVAALLKGEFTVDPINLIRDVQKETGCSRSEVSAAFCKTVLSYRAEEIVNRYPLHLLKMKNVIDDTVYTSLLTRHFCGLALSPDKDGNYPLQKALEDDDARLAVFKKFEPHARAHELAEDRKIDFYRAMQSVLARSSHYEFFNQEIEKLVEQEIFEHGERREVSSYDQNREIATMARQMAALDYIDGSWQFADHLYELEADKREQLINQLHYVTLFTPGIIPELRNCLTDITARDALLESTISGHMQELFDLNPELHGVVKLDSIPDAEMLRALVSYYSTTCVGNERMEDPFREYSARIFNGQFYTWRAWGTEEEPRTAEERECALVALKEERLIPEEITLKQYIAWQSELKGEVEADVSENESQLYVECKRIMKRAVPLHIPSHEVEGDVQSAIRDFRSFIAPLNRYMQQINEYREKLKSKECSDEERALTVKLFKEAKEDQQQFLEKSRDGMTRGAAKIMLQHVVHGPGPLRDGKMLVQSKWVSIDEVFKKLQNTYGSKYPDFAVDLRNIENCYRKIEKIHTGKAEISKSVLSLSDRVDMKTYFFMGERPVQSCQHYDSANGYNQGLLATSTDPAMKVLQVYDEKGRIVSRAVLRLLEDESGQAALLLERIYSMNNHPDIYKSVHRFAAAKAEMLGVKLYGQPTELSFADFNFDDITNLVSRSSRSGYVYTDAGGGLQKRGEFVARHAIRLGSRSSNGPLTVKPEGLESP